jgi:hypothetical protein
MVQLRGRVTFVVQCWFECSGMLQHVSWQIVADVLKNHTALIIRVHHYLALLYPEANAQCSSNMSAIMTIPRGATSQNIQIFLFLLQ